MKTRLCDLSPQHFMHHIKMLLFIHGGRLSGLSPAALLALGRVRVSVAVLDPPTEVHVFEDRVEALAVVAGPLVTAAAHGASRECLDVRIAVTGGILDVEDRLVIVGKGREVRALVVLHALFVHREVHDVDNAVDDGGSVLEACDHALIRGLLGQEAHEVDRVFLAQVEPVLVVVAVHVVRVDGVAAHVGGYGDAVRHDVADILAVQLEPVLAGPAVQLLALVVVVEPPRVGAVRLVGPGAEVADDRHVPLLQVADDGQVLVEEHVDVVDGHLWVARVGGGDVAVVVYREGLAEHDLPLGVQRQVARRGGEGAVPRAGWLAAIPIVIVVVAATVAEPKAEPETKCQCQYYDDGDSDKGPLLPAKAAMGIVAIDKLGLVIGDGLGGSL
ncbi:hypothetical protein FJTKL_12257 [Diaporthe vaccinii]|uniref:Uncharacterized protein n=1 Tax=Diaporthe vaccinii TaxID=105482 RepID=A0ABR4EE48_9PEZI